MATWDGEDRLRGFSGTSRTANDGAAARFPRASLAGSSRRDRAAWFNRKTGAGAVKLAPERPAGSQRVIVKTRVVVHAKVGGGGGGGGGAGGIYSAARHTQLIPSDQQKYIDMHVRRLEALRMSGVVERTPDGQFL